MTGCSQSPVWSNKRPFQITSGIDSSRPKATTQNILLHFCFRHYATNFKCYAMQLINGRRSQSHKIVNRIIQSIIPSIECTLLLSRRICPRGIAVVLNTTIQNNWVGLLYSGKYFFKRSSLIALNIGEFLDMNA